ncbi:unnamed protein product [Orchesella dallaii]|uniref:glucan endo-1,3-beta-D-glucosidase n=1 Tax=Orchesella dallaii TaxID=48710 RepID=A0ABP1R7V0_9HEXA
MSKSSGLLPILFLVVFTITKKVNSQLGVVYSPFVQPGDTPSSTSSYTEQDVRTMLSLLVEDNFPFVTTFGMGAPNEHYQENSTRYRCTSVVHTAIAAANINKEKNNLALTVFQGIYKGSPSSRLNSEIEVGFEIAQAANLIYEGTVPALVFPTSAGLFGLFDMLEKFESISVRARNSKLKIGVRLWNCHHTITGVDKNDKNIQDLIKLFDFIICQVIPVESDYLQGVVPFFEKITKEFVEVENAVKEMGINATKIVLESGWASVPNENNLNNGTIQLKTFWEKMGQWANSEKKIVFMTEAFDNPWKEGNKELFSAAHYGLWKHVQGDSNSKSAYVRKVSEIQNGNYRKPKPKPVTPAITERSNKGKQTKPQKNTAVGNGFVGGIKIQFLNAIVLFIAYKFN